jgi:hypothetical protein
MKRFIVFFAIMALIIAMLGCAVNATTGSITVLNQTNTDASNVKVGSVSIGFVGKGQTTTIFFYKSEDSAQVSADGFVPNFASNTGKIKLKLNYSYSLSLYKSGAGANIYYISGYNTSGTGSETDYQETMH